MFITRVISEGGLTGTDTGFRVEIRLPWYRSLSLSTVEIAELSIDGQIIDKSAIVFDLNKEIFTPGELMSHPEKWWFVLDSAYLDVRHRLLEAGSQHEVTVTLGIFPPYIPGFHRLTACSKTLEVGARLMQGKTT